MKTAESLHATTATSSAHMNGHHFLRCTATVVPHLDRGVVRTVAEIQKLVNLCTAHLVHQLAWCTVDPHRRDSLGTTGLGGGGVLNGVCDVAVVNRRTDENPGESGGGPSHTKGEGKAIQFHLLIFSSIFCIGISRYSTDRST